MDRFDKIYRLHGLLSNRHTPLSLERIRERIRERLDCSKSTATRTIEPLRDYLNAPLEYNREANGYFLTNNPQENLMNYLAYGLAQKNCTAY